MVSPVTLLIGILSATMAGAMAMDFSPRLSVRELDGAHFSQLLFTDGPADVSYEPPRGWSYSGEKNVLTLWLPGKDQVDAKIVVARTGAAPVALDPAGMKALRARAQALLPHGSQQVQLISEAKDAVTIDAHETYEATFEYGLFGQKFRTCIVFAFLGDQQMTVQLSSHPADFAEIYRSFHGSLFSFHWHKVT